MNTIYQTNKQNVSNVVFINRKKEIVTFSQFENPIPKEEIVFEELCKVKFTSAIVQFYDGASYTYVPKKSKIN